MKNNIRARRKVVLLTGLSSLLAVSTSQLHAQDGGKAMGIPWGPVTVYPEVDLTFKSNDNIYSQAATKTSSNIFVVAPRIKVEARQGPNTYDATYYVEHGAYSGASSANYTNQGIIGNAAWVFTGRSGLKLKADYILGHDDQGSIPGAATHSGPDKWHSSSISGVAGYGAPGARGRVELAAGYKSLRYDNFKFDGFGNPDSIKRDHDDTNVGATFFWQVMPKTQLLFQVDQTKIDYPLATFVGVGATGWTSLDATDRKYLVGVTWEAAAKTTGVFKIGTMKKDFDDASLRDFSGTSWDGTVTWRPLTYSIFNFTTGRTISEAVIGNASIDNKYGVSWSHAWNSRLSSVASLSNIKSEYQGNAGVQQTDKTNALGLKLNYVWSRNIKVGAGYDRTDRTSDVAASAYKRNLYSVFLNAAI